MKTRLLTVLATVAMVSACASTSTDEEFAENDAPVAVNETRNISADATDRVFFGFDRSDLSAEARATLDKQIEVLREDDSKILVEGHTDDRGTEEYNMALGERRAAAVKNYMIYQGISADRIDTISYGKRQPAVAGMDESAWSQNRRAQTKVAK
ncbi:MAG: peptidoglycan-associated lipoprotein Pal [Alphaproteobacteria bacterium]|nr:peptidoglycan-associated lipoprotein Pal [Alphaproteobacteria bacterium]